MKKNSKKLKRFLENFLFRLMLTYYVVIWGGTSLVYFVKSIFPQNSLVKQAYEVSSGYWDILQVVAGYLPQNILGLIVMFVLVISVIFLPHTLFVIYGLVSSLFLYIFNKEKFNKLNQDQLPLAAEKIENFFNNFETKIYKQKTKFNVVKIGTLVLSDNNIYIGDPLTEVGLLKDKFFPGKYPVFASFAEYDDDKRIAFVKIVLSSKSSDSYTPAMFVYNTNTFGVDSGSGCICGKDSGLYINGLSKSENEREKFYKLLREEEEKTHVPTIDYTDLQLPECKDSLVTFSSGYGDGLYPVYYAKAGVEIVSIYIDFGLYDNSVKLHKSLQKREVV